MCGLSRDQGPAARLMGPTACLVLSDGDRGLVVRADCPGPEMSSRWWAAEASLGPPLTRRVVWVCGEVVVPGLGSGLVAGGIVLRDERARRS
jgi:hypothetical protein